MIAKGKGGRRPSVSPASRQRYASVTTFANFGDELRLRIEKREVSLVFVSKSQATAQELFNKLDADLRKGELHLKIRADAPPRVSAEKPPRRMSKRAAE